MNEENYRKLEAFFIRGDMAGAIACMKEIPELADMTKAYTDLFEREQYIRYDVPEALDRILRCYQRYFRQVFYLRKNSNEAEYMLFDELKKELSLSDPDPAAMEAVLRRRFRREGYQILCGKTNGYYGPYVWKETHPVTYEVVLPETVCTCRINMLSGFVCRGWMDYLTFGEKGTGGWTSPDGTIYCVEKAYDMQSERFRISLLRHEAQHAEDIRRWKNIKPCELEYRAKLVELIYTEETELLPGFCREADPLKTEDSHALAAARIQREMGSLLSAGIPRIQKQAELLFAASTREMESRYGSAGTA